MFHGFMSNLQRTAISVTSCFADLGPCSDCMSARYCNSVLAGISCQLQDWLQTVLNAAAHLVFSVRRSECITPLLRELHWLTVPKWVTFWLCVLAYRCLHGTAPSYLVASSLRTSDVDICH